MRKLIAAAALLLLAGAGCVAVSEKGNHYSSDRELVVVKDRVYLVDKSSGCVSEVDLVNATHCGEHQVAAN